MSRSDEAVCEVTDLPLPEPPCGLELPCPVHDEGQVFVYTVNGVPRTGTLTDYAKTWGSAQYASNDIVLSRTVLTWDDTSDPITWDVRITRDAMYDDCIPYRVAVVGFPGEVGVSIDGRG